MDGAGAASAIGAGLGLFGTVLTNKSNRDSVNSANAASAAQAREQMAFQERMSNTAWQRGVEDMRKAGINPMMAFSQGPASSAAGAQGSVQAARAENPLSYAGEGVSSALKTVSVNQELKNQVAQEQLTQAGILKQVADTQVASATAEQIRKGMPVVEGKAASAMSESQARIAESRATQAEAGAREKHGGYDSTLAPIDAAARRLTEWVGSAIGVGAGLRMLKGLGDWNKAGRPIRKSKPMSEGGENVRSKQLP